MIASLPEFWIISRPEIETAEAYCVIENCAAEIGEFCETLSTS